MHRGARVARNGQKLIAGRRIDGRVRAEINESSAGRWLVADVALSAASLRAANGLLPFARLRACGYRPGRRREVSVGVWACEDSLESGERLEEADGFEGAVAPSERQLFHDVRGA